MRNELIVLVIILASFFVGVYFYPQVPEQMASHWNVQGEVNGYMPKFWGMFLMPFVFVGLFLLFVAIPKIDPLKYNVKKFRKYYDYFIILFFVFMFYIYILTVFWNVGMRFNMSQLMIPAIGILFYYCGILVENAKRNWFIGIRTPWTLSNDKVWNKTHKLGGKLFKISGILAFGGILFEEYSIWFILIPVFFVTAYTVIYSYFEYQKEQKK